MTLTQPAVVRTVFFICLPLFGFACQSQIEVREVMNHAQCHNLEIGAQIVSIQDLAKIRGANFLEPIEQPTLETDSPTPLLVAVFTGAKPTPGYKLRLLGADKKGNEIVLHYELDKPTDAILAQMITSPCSVVEVSGANHRLPISVRVNGQLLGSEKL